MALFTGAIAGLQSRLHGGQVTRIAIVNAGRVKSGGRIRQAVPCANVSLYTPGMAQPLPMPPSGFDELTIEDKIDYVQSLWDRIAASADQVPLHEWQRQLLEERLAAHRAADSNEARPWGEVLERLEGRLRASSR